jgi:acetyltransferase-like isoleucine patch superfamily enzyme
MPSTLTHLSNVLKYELQKRRIIPDHRIKIDKTTVIFPSVSTVCRFSGQIQIGKRCQINEHCYIQAHEKPIKIGDDVLIGPFTVIHNANHMTRANKTINQQGVVGRPIVIEDDVWVGAHCTILGGVRIGAHSVIGAHSLVNKSIPQNSIAYGTPCKAKKQRI